MHPFAGTVHFAYPTPYGLFGMQAHYSQVAGCQCEGRDSPATTLLSSFGIVSGITSSRQYNALTLGASPGRSHPWRESVAHPGAMCYQLQSSIASSMSIVSQSILGRH